MEEVTLTGSCEVSESSIAMDTWFWENAGFGKMQENAGFGEKQEAHIQKSQARVCKGWRASYS